MGCPAAGCGPRPVPAGELHGADVVEAERVALFVATLSQEGPELGDAPCCAFCAGVHLDPAVTPENPHRLLSRGKGCPLSIVAYRARAENDKGRRVEVVPQKELEALERQVSSFTNVIPSVEIVTVLSSPLIAVVS